MRTYIVVSILYQERDALALCTLPACVPLQLVLRSGNIVDQLAVCEASPGQGVDDGGALGIMLLDGLEDGQAGERGCHSESDSCTHATVRE